MRKSLNRKRALLHDTLHSNLKGNHKVTAFETAEGEQYTIDLLRKTEERNQEEQRKFLQRYLERQERLKNEERRKRLAIQKRIADAKTRFATHTCRKERCLSCLKIKQEEERNSRLKSPVLSLEKSVGLHTVSEAAQFWNRPMPTPR